MARNLSKLGDLQELALYGNKITGRMEAGSPVCDLAQGSLEMLQLGALGLAGPVPACLFDGNSTLVQLSAAYNQLSGPLPDAFKDSELAMLNLAGVRRTCCCRDEKAWLVGSAAGAWPVLTSRPLAHANPPPLPHLQPLHRT